MAKVNIVRWDATNLLPQLLSEQDTAMINHIDVTGSAGSLTLGSGSATDVVLGRTGNNIVLSGTSEVKANATWDDDVFAFFGTDGDTSIEYDATAGNMLISGSAVAQVEVFGAILSASTGAKITGSVDLPGQTSFLVDGVALTTENFTALNLDTLLNGSNADSLHVHSLSAGDLSSSLIQDGDFTHLYQVGGAVANAVSGTQVVYLSEGANKVDLADADAVASSRIIGIASGTTATTYASGANVPVFTIYGDRFDGFTGLTPAAVYYLDTTPGGLTTTPSAESGRTIVQVGIATSTTELILQPDIRTRGLA